VQLDGVFIERASPAGDWPDGARGFRRAIGLDAVRMLALGARGVLLGRAWAFALAACGQAGVTQMLELMSQEMMVAIDLDGRSERS
jgi:isopentenyl diphosphate isomerase/L-lactate dehydrogenase-like FMN-dependent dehydrogenase